MVQDPKTAAHASSGCSLELKECMLPKHCCCASHYQMRLVPRPPAAVSVKVGCHAAMDATEAGADTTQAADGVQTPQSDPPAEAMARSGSPEEKEGNEAAVAQRSREPERTLVSVDALMAAYEALGQEAMYVVQSCADMDPML